LPVGLLKPGLNKLRMEVRNNSPNRGMLAELGITVSAKE